MNAKNDSQLLEARVITPADMDSIEYIVRRSSRIYLSMGVDHLPQHLLSAYSWMVEGDEQIRAFVAAEIRPFSVAVITSVGVDSGQKAASCVAAFLPPLKDSLSSAGAEGLVQVGYAPWLVEVLKNQGFCQRESVMTYGWEPQPVQVGGNKDVKVEPGRHEDLSDIVALDREIFGSIWHKHASEIGDLLARVFAFSVAHWNDQVVGYQWSEMRGDHGHVSRLGVHPDWQGRGVGTRLLTEVLSGMLESGVTWVTVNTQESNLRSRRLYEGHGFRPVSQRVPVLWQDLH